MTVETGNPVDEKGRLKVSQMTDRELLEEVVISQRRLADMVDDLMRSMETNPMIRMLGPKSLKRR